MDVECGVADVVSGEFCEFCPRSFRRNGRGDCGLVRS